LPLAAPGGTHPSPSQAATLSPRDETEPSRCLELGQPNLSVGPDPVPYMPVVVSSSAIEGGT
jgi:hypothetical protein